ncbi:hypothetical protein HanPI659440_Chr06g0230781 [Helianthus annuus]|nr:hypothetical protein HanHA300_Chr12g0446991 [Helianthus annuus]KAJ0493627.1 hypothetical protein HanIR_Chr12g0588281 [Helianthus annuus]KAJ0505616.1 hypothetical protein HanHA89_Chr12g0472521 [Helianthus annuus]KAJ0675280.1 hypothetical protein HanLR1_Chr12g0449411 [Helianthus annuus]KAJ0678578.1 hypothetical protein HanOQP8_Chr12g0449501 [Helianthus annuus]
MLPVAKRVMLSKKMLKMFSSIQQCACSQLRKQWRLWNRVIYNNDQVFVSKVVEDIKALGYLWIKHRSKMLESVSLD